MKSGYLRETEHSCSYGISGPLEDFTVGTCRRVLVLMREFSMDLSGGETFFKSALRYLIKDSSVRT